MLLRLAMYSVFFVACCSNETAGLESEDFNENREIRISLSEYEARFPREPLRGLYLFLNLRPKLMGRRFYIGSRPPLLGHPSLSFKESLEIKKRGDVLDMSRARPVCPYTTEWQMIYRAKDINDNMVDVFQPSDPSSEDHQWFYTVICDSATLFQEDPTCPNCCRGIDPLLYTSECMPKKSFVMALVKLPTERTFDWNWIQVDTSCSCAINDEKII